jgi:hypothetical protein
VDWRVWSRAGVWVDDRVISVEFVDFQGVLVSDYQSGQTLQSTNLVAVTKPPHDSP